MKEIKISVFSKLIPYLRPFKSSCVKGLFASLAFILLIAWTLFFYNYVYISCYDECIINLDKYFMDNKLILDYIIKSNSVFAVVVSVIVYFFRVTSLEYKSSIAVSHEIRNIIPPGKKDDNIHKQCAEDFISNSVADLEFLGEVTNNLRAFAATAYVQSFIYIFFLTVWAVLYIPLGDYDITQNIWIRYRGLVGLFFFPVLLITISLFGIVYPFQIFLRKRYLRCLDNRNIFELFVKFESAYAKNKAFQEAVNGIKTKPPNTTPL